MQTRLNSHGCLNPPECAAHDNNKSTLALSLLLLSLLALAYIGVPSPSFSLYPCQCFCLSGKMGQRTAVAFVGFVIFLVQIALLFPHPAHPHLFWLLLWNGDVTAHSLATCLFLFTPSVVHICFSSLLSLCTSGSLRSLQPLRARWTLKSHGTLSECQPTPTPQTPLARTGLLHCAVEPQSLSQWADILNHPNKPDTAH